MRFFCFLSLVGGLLFTFTSDSQEITSIEQLSIGISGQTLSIGTLELSRDGRYLLLGAPLVGLPQLETGLFLYDTTSYSLTKIAHSHVTASMSVDGRSIVFMNHTLKTDHRFYAYLHDRVTNVTHEITSPFVKVVQYAVISADGNTVLYQGQLSSTDVTCPSCLQVYVWDRLQNTHQLVSVSTMGLMANDQSESGAISADGNRVLFFLKPAIYPLKIAQRVIYTFMIGL